MFNILVISITFVISVFRFSASLDSEVTIFYKNNSYVPTGLTDTRNPSSSSSTNKTVQNPSAAAAKKKNKTIIEDESKLSVDFVESHPKLSLKSYELFVLNRTVELIDNSTLKIPRVFTNLVFECNSTLPTRWHFSGRVRDANVQSLTVRKYRHYNEDINFRSTIQINFRNPDAIENITCQNECPAELRAINKSCEYLWASGINKDRDNPSGDPFFVIQIMNGAGSVDKGNKTHKLGSEPECNFSLHIDLKEGKYECKRKNGSVEVEMPTVYLPCGNLDECGMFYQKEKKICKNTGQVKETCTGNNCFRLKSISSPFIISCGEDNEISLARSYYPLALVSQLNRSFSTIRDYALLPLADVEDNFAEIFTDKQINVLKLNASSTEPLYTGDSRTFECTGLRSVFSCGFRWFLVYKNETVKELGLGVENDDATDSMPTIYVSTYNVTFDSDEVKQVKCDAPWWNSFKWAHVNYTVSVTHPVQPSFNFGLNCSSIGCSCEDGERRVSFVCPKNGSPRGNIKWKIDAVDVNQSPNYFNGSWYEIKENETHSELRLNAKQNRYEEVTSVQCSARNREDFQTACHLFRIKQGFSITLLLGIVIGSIVALSASLLLLSWCKIKRQKEKLQLLPDQEVDEFENGNPNGTEAFLLPYNMELEIPPEDLIMSDQVLGSGAFAQVVKGQVGLTTVAIKRLKKTADVVYMRALLSELKIMSYVGRHPHIVNLVGSCTRNIRKRELSVILEFCERGDLLTLLRNARKVFVDKFETSNQTFNKLAAASIRCSTIVYQNASVKKLSTINLMKWAHEIASGMEFLSSKNVIHGDLAGRNILVTYDLRAKVSDFGLSKQLFDYSIYVQKINIPLPLRWMAYESLKDLEFSIESDIWSYGIVLWELFSLGEAPYPGMEWGFGAWKLILNGHRMEKPAFASDSIYKIMLQCWDIQPNARPPFSLLKRSTLEMWRDVRQLSAEYL